MSSAANKQIARRFYEEVCNQRKFDLICQFAAENYQHHNPSLPPEMQHGRDNFARVLGMFFSAFPDLQGTIDLLIGEGDKIVSRVTWSGSHGGDLMGIPPSGRPVNFSVIEIYRLVDGRFVEGWAALDMLGLMQQIGAIPSPAPAPAPA